LAYRGRDPHIPTQRVPQGEVDVATIARSLPPMRDVDDTRLHRRWTEEGSTSSGNAALMRRPIFHSLILDDPMDPPANDSTRRLPQNDRTSITPGEGWSVVGDPSGFCDGTSTSVYYRH